MLMLQDFATAYLSNSLINSLRYSLSNTTALAKNLGKVTALRKNGGGQKLLENLWPKEKVESGGRQKKVKTSS